MSNPRPRLNQFERSLVCVRVTERGWTVRHAAEAAGVSRQTVHKWLRRFAAEGLAGLADRSSRPHHMPRLTRIDRVVEICVERLRPRRRGAAGPCANVDGPSVVVTTCVYPWTASSCALRSDAASSTDSTESERPAR